VADNVTLEGLTNVVLLAGLVIATEMKPDPVKLMPAALGPTFTGLEKPDGVKL
jgi:hypothetical protein